MSLAAILFGIAALGGVVMAIMRFTGSETPPLALALLHGALAASGLVTLIVAVTGGGLPSQATLVLGVGGWHGSHLVFIMGSGGHRPQI